MKYQRLPLNELQRLEKDFVYYLITQGIDASQWQEIKVNEPLRAETLIDEFSDLVYETTLEKVNYLEYRSSHNLRVFHCLPQKILMMGLDVSKAIAVDFTKKDGLNSLLSDNKNLINGVELLYAEKDYQKPRNEEIFEMMSKGCVKTDETLFNLLQKLKTK